MPPAANVNGLNRPPLNTDALPPRSTARLMGAAHHPCRRLNPSVTAMAAAPVSASLTVSHRALVTLWFQVSRLVPVSSSRAISGAPQKTPVIAGAMRMNRMPTV